MVIILTTFGALHFQIRELGIRILRLRKLQNQNAFTYARGEDYCIIVHEYFGPAVDFEHTLDRAINKKLLQTEFF